MDKNLINMLTDRLVKKWGSQKFVSVITLTSISAGITCLISANLIPNDPELDEPQNVTKSTKTKKENV